jgi:hypothetical protein
MTDLRALHRQHGDGARHRPGQPAGLARHNGLRLSSLRCGNNTAEEQ